MIRGDLLNIGVQNTVGVLGVGYVLRSVLEE